MATIQLLPILNKTATILAFSTNAKKAFDNFLEANTSTQDSIPKSLPD